jgi:hypothetical protein
MADEHARWERLRFLLTAIADAPVDQRKDLEPAFARYLKATDPGMGEMLARWARSGVFLSEAAGAGAKRIRVCSRSRAGLQSEPRRQFRA